MDLTNITMLNQIDASKGTKIQATVMNNYLKKFDRFLKEYECLRLEKPVIGDNVSNKPFLEHKHKLFFTCETNVKKCDDFLGTIHWFNFVAFNILHDNGVPNDSTVGIVIYL